jgi:hypothetical protein
VEEPRLAMTAPRIRDLLSDAPPFDILSPTAYADRDKQAAKRKATKVNKEKRKRAGDRVQHQTEKNAARRLSAELDPINEDGTDDD